nr:zinc ribbon domain-containing protein [uncultured Anaerobutyricum sp.]
MRCFDFCVEIFEKVNHNAQPRTELSKFINACPSSKKCCKCGRIKKELKLSERVYHCACGNKMDRDRNAAINIREEARRMLTA